MKEQNFRVRLLERDLVGHKNKLQTTRSSEREINILFLRRGMLEHSIMLEHNLSLSVAKMSTLRGRVLTWRYCPKGLACRCVFSGLGLQSSRSTPDQSQKNVFENYRIIDSQIEKSLSSPLTHTYRSK